MTSSSPVHGPDGGGGRDRDGERLPRPPAFAFPAQTWKEIAYLLANLPVGIVCFILTLVWLAVGMGLSVTVVGLPLLALGLRFSRLLGRLERNRARSLLSVRIEEPSPLPYRPDSGVLSRLWTSLRDPVGWRATLYALIRLPWSVVTFALTLTSLFVAWPVLPWIARGLTHVDRAMVRGLLFPSDELERRIA
ncbi:sensor domain-containing protein, partial [Streptomyces sp. 4503]